jgi:predicted phage-related endonuclease
MRNLNLGLSLEQIAGRRNALGGSDANVLMNGDDNAVLNLWRVKRGEVQSEDLSGVLPVMMGCATEEFNRYWFEKTTGRTITNEGEQSTHEDYPFMACTLDGLTTTEEGHPAVFEAKHVNAFSNIDETIQRYMPQLHHNMLVRGLEHAVLSVFVGTLKYETAEVKRDDWYLAQLVDRERKFWASVESGETPCDMPAIASPVAPSAMRTVDFNGSNEWSSHAADWLANQKAAKTFKAAGKGIKGLMLADIGHGFGYGIACKRAKNGSLTIKAEK